MKKKSGKTALFYVHLVPAPQVFLFFALIL